MLLADADGTAPGLLGDVHIEAGAGADDHIAVQGAQMLGDPPVGEGAVLLVAPLGGGEDGGGALLFGVVALVAGGVLAEVDEVAQAHVAARREDRLVAVAEHRDDLHVVLLGERARQVERRPDRPADAVRIVNKE